MSDIPPELKDDVNLLLDSVHKRIAFNAGKNRLIGELVAFDPDLLKLRIMVTSGREAGLHTMRLSRMSNYAILEPEERKAAPSNGKSIKAK